MGVKIFVEYKVLAQKRDEFLQMIPELKKVLTEDWNANDLQIYEGVDQPALFVEEFVLERTEDYRRLKAARLQGDSPFWQRLHACVEGGPAKVHVWAFQAVT